MPKASMEVLTSTSVRAPQPSNDARPYGAEYVVVYQHSCLHVYVHLKDVLLFDILIQESLDPTSKHL